MKTAFICYQLILSK